MSAQFSHATRYVHLCAVRERLRCTTGNVLSLFVAYFLLSVPTNPHTIYMLRCLLPLHGYVVSLCLVFCYFFFCFFPNVFALMLCESPFCCAFILLSLSSAGPFHEWKYTSAYNIVVGSVFLFFFLLSCAGWKHDARLVRPVWVRRRCNYVCFLVFVWCMCVCNRWAVGHHQPHQCWFAAHRPFACQFLRVMYIVQTVYICPKAQNGDTEGYGIDE